MSLHVLRAPKFAKYTIIASKPHIINYINFTNGTNYLFNYILFAISLLLEHIKCQFVLFCRPTDTHIKRLGDGVTFT